MGWDWTKARTYQVKMPVNMLREQQYYVMANMKRQYDEYDEYVAYLTSLEGPGIPTERA